MAAACCLALLSGQAQARSLKDAVLLAVGTHPSVDALRASRDSASHDLDTARADYLPTVDLDLSAGYQNVTNSTSRGRATRPEDGDSGHVSAFLYNKESLIIRENLFKGYESQGREASALATMSERDFQVQDISELIALRAAQAYFDVMRAGENLSLAETSVTDHLDTLEEIRIRVETGGGSPVEIDQVEGRLAIARSRVADAKLALRTAESLYEEAVGEISDGVDMPALPVADIPQDLESALLVAEQNSPALKSAQARSRARGADVTVSRAGMYPTVDLELGFNAEDNVDADREPSRDVTMLLKLRYNLYRGGADKSREASARQLLVESRHREAEVRRTLRKSVSDAFNTLEIARDQREINSSRVASSEKVTATYEEQFILGQRTLIETMDARTELSQARSALNTATIQEAFAHYQLLAAMGRLVPTLGGE